MKVEVVLLPRDLRPGQLAGRACACIRRIATTTTMTAAMAAHVREIRLFGDLESARAAAGEFAGEKLLCGESRCLPPQGFDLGNSPGQFINAHRSATMFMCTTNGTRALIAATDAAAVFTAALVNARAVADSGADEDRAGCNAFVCRHQRRSGDGGHARRRRCYR